VENLTDVAAQRHRRGMNELLVRNAYQQSDKISPPSATGCTRSASAMIASALTTADRHESDFQAVAGIRTIGLQGLGTSSGAHRTSDA
jgi:hypothetical protein